MQESSQGAQEKKRIEIDENRTTYQNCRGHCNQSTSKIHRKIFNRWNQNFTVQNVALCVSYPKKQISTRSDIIYYADRAKIKDCAETCIQQCPMHIKQITLLFNLPQQDSTNPPAFKASYSSFQVHNATRFNNGSSHSNKKPQFDKSSETTPLMIQRP